MKKTARILGYSSLLLSGLTLVHLQPSQTRGTLLFWVLKMLAGALSPFLALAGGLGTLLGLIDRDRNSVWAGLFGTAIAVRHIVKVTEPHKNLDRIPPPDSPIPPELQARMLPNRYTPIPDNSPQVPWERNVTIGTHVETGEQLLADVWYPPKDIPCTGLGIIYLHGSAWHYGDKDMGTRHFFRHLAGQGHVIADVAYTLAPKANLEAMVADVKRAIAWMKESGPAYGVNPERVVLMGGSAGGHLALLSAYTPNHPAFQPADVDSDTSVRAVVSYYGPTDLESNYRYFLERMGKPSLTSTPAGQPLLSWLQKRLHRNRFLPPGNRFVPFRDVVSNLLGGTPDEIPERYRLVSPIHHVGPDCPPTLLLQGDHDWFGMAPDVRRLDLALQEAGVPSALVEFRDTDHAFDLIAPRWAPAAQAATYDTERFLAQMI